MLARAFPGAAGFYVRGWSGVNIEPLSANSVELRRKRPRDINLEIAVGEEEGTITFYEIGKWHGYSTTDAALAEQHRQDGLKVVEHKVPVRKLSTILDEHAAGRAIDFLKIDVEGTELSVLRGADLRRHRPKIIVLESKMPVTLNMVDRVDEVPRSEEHTSDFLSPLGYHFIYHDGLNSFFLAEESRALEKAFTRPPDTFDKITHAASIRPYAGEIAKLKRQRWMLIALAAAFAVAAILAFVLKLK